ncbi:MAG TPA: energy transducer TonB [Stellaceae bacterium]|nr:energy transducer TonB [Stellaceae bacterium]
MAITASAADFERPAIGSRRWAACFAVILAIHVVGFWVAMAVWPQAEPIDDGLPPVTMIELAPLPVAPQLAAPPEEAKPPEPLPREATAPPSPAPVIAAPLPPKPKPVRPPQITAAPAPAEAQPSSAPPAPVISAPRPSNAVPNWQSALLARLEQFKRYPALAQFRRQQGVVYLHFTMDRQGRVLSARIEKSSGFDALDDEALALIHRAEPLPPPAEVSGETLSLTVPVQFFLK